MLGRKSSLKQLLKYLKDHGVSVYILYSYFWKIVVLFVKSSGNDIICKFFNTINVSVTWL